MNSRRENPQATGAKGDVRSRRAGLTLIEVMLAVAILGIAGVSLISAMGQGLAVVRVARLYNHAHTLINRVELENPLFADDIEIGRESGSFPDNALGVFRWEREITAIGEEEDGLFEVRIRISWSQRGQTSYEEVRYFRYAPEEES